MTEHQCIRKSKKTEYKLNSEYLFFSTLNTRFTQTFISFVKEDESETITDVTTAHKLLKTFRIKLNIVYCYTSQFIFIEQTLRKYS